MNEKAGFQIIKKVETCDVRDSKNNPYNNNHFDNSFKLSK